MNDSNPYDVTQDQPGKAQGDAALQEHPERIGRYRIEKVLGKGGFGLVYLAHDEQLDRSVAVKVPHAGLVSQSEDAAAYLTEARTVANLDHPHIVPVHDVGSTDEFPCYIVSKYVEGADLASKLQQSRLKHTEAAELVATVAEALHYAHKQGLVHRDIKTGNILVAADGKPYVVDFGLALREENIGQGTRFAGTPAYMSPEQARGEGHRVDGRSDIYSLGAVCYELLTGKRTVSGETKTDILQQISSHEPKPLRQIDDVIPRELERICLKALSKRASERYTTALDMAEDLRHFLAQQTAIASSTTPGTSGNVTTVTATRTPPSTSVGSFLTPASSPGSGALSDSQPLRIVPKGLRSFDAQDADFFLELLPGPRDREGLPDSLRFWKARIEETDPENTFPVGLVYGPSGCGKSSLVKAGLLPRLSDDVISVCIEATPDETETRLLYGLRKRCPGLTDNLSLKDTLAALRRAGGGPAGKKVLIVLDQFEQWLHAKKEEENTDLVQALRQCDGGRVQCIVMVRADFWLAVSRFLRELEIRLVEGENSALTDLFDVDHARKVLAAFGRAFGKLPEDTSETTKEHQEFLKQSVAGLVEEGKVICVRLALFAQMMKGKPWTPATLKEVGGTQGVRVTFLEETFSASTAPPEHRYHQKAARAVLKALLPESGTDIKGQMKSRDELLGASGHANRHIDFDDLIRILDSEIRLITPTDPEGVETDDDSTSQIEAGQKYYQLTHDYLVPSLREWLTRKQKETRRGRAELRLAERSALWNAKPENRRLPSWWENLNIRLFTDKKKWTASQRKMMGTTGIVHGLRTGLVALLLIGVSFIGLSIRNSVVQTKNVTRAEGLVESLLNAEITQVPAVISDMKNVREWADPLLKNEITTSADGSAEKLHLALALLPVDDSQIDYLSGQLPLCTLDQFSVVRDALLPHKEKITDGLWQLVQDDEQDAAQRLQASAALAQYAPEDERWNGVASFGAQQLTSAVSPVYVGQWLEYFQFANQQLTDSLAGIHADRSRSEKQRETAALALAVYLQDKPGKLADVILVADELAEFSPLIDALRPHAAAVRRRMIGEMGSPMPDKPTVEQRDAHWKRQSLAAVTLVHLGHGDDVWPLLKLTPDPSLRSLIIHHLGELRADHNTLAARLEVDSEVSIRRALIQSLGGLRSALIRPADRNRIAEQLRALYVNDPDPGIHSSASWTLRQWGMMLPELPVGEPILTDEQKQRIAKPIAEVKEIRRRIAAYQHEELPKRQAAWMRQLREQPPALPATLSKGLVAHYPLDATEGTETVNAVAGQPGGIFQGPGQPEWVTGIVADALRLDGRGGHINCGNVFNPERTDAFSCGCWLFTEEHATASILSNYVAEGSGGRGFHFWLQSGRVGANLAHQFTGGDALKVFSDNSVPGGAWHHVLITYDGSSLAAGLQVFVDGKGVPSGVVDNKREVTATIQTGLSMTIGQRHSLKGQIDDVRIYNRQLTHEEVHRLYESGLRALARIPAEERSAEQQALLMESYRSKDERLQALENQLAAARATLREARWDGVRRWYVNRQGQTMVVPSEYGNNQIDHSFAISSHEVTLAEYRRFRQQYIGDRNIAPTEDCPVIYMTWYEAAEYCNWLSKQEGISEDQWVYEPNDDGKYAEGMKIKENFLKLRGYRLPTEAEWEHACRAGTSGSYCFGEQVPLLQRYSQFVLNSSGRSHSVESLLPNDAGLFDMHGNVWEWTQNSVSGPLSPVRNTAQSRVLRGGAFIHLPENIRSGRLLNQPDNVFNALGFRPARTCP